MVGYVPFVSNANVPSTKDNLLFSVISDCDSCDTTNRPSMIVLFGAASNGCC